MQVLALQMQITGSFFIKLLPKNFKLLNPKTTQLRMEAKRYYGKNIERWTEHSGLNEFANRYNGKYELNI